MSSDALPCSRTGLFSCLVQVNKKYGQDYVAIIKGFFLSPSIRWNLCASVGSREDLGCTKNHFCAFHDIYMWKARKQHVDINRTDNRATSKNICPAALVPAEGGASSIDETQPSPPSHPLIFCFRNQAPGGTENESTFRHKNRPVDLL